jgi:hypothetical protein
MDPRVKFSYIGPLSLNRRHVYLKLIIRLIHFIKNKVMFCGTIFVHVIDRFTYHMILLGCQAELGGIVDGFFKIIKITYRFHSINWFYI